MLCCRISFSADTRTKNGQATADKDAEVNVREHATLLKQQNKENRLNKHGMLRVQLQLSADTRTMSGQATADERSTGRDLY